MSSALREFASMLERLPADDSARKTILESWARCTSTKLSRGDPPRFHRVSDTDLLARLSVNALMLDVAGPILADLHHNLSGSTNVTYLTDAHGIVLLSLGSPAHIDAWALSPGFDWSEQRMGTNGAGTCLVTGRPVAVIGDEHFASAFSNCTCTATPIRNAERRIVGALDVSSTVSDADPNRIRAVVEAGEAIERALGLRSRTERR